MKTLKVFVYVLCTVLLYVVPYRTDKGFFAGIEIVIPGLAIAVILGLQFLISLITQFRRISTKFNVMLVVLLIYSVLLLLPFHKLSTAFIEKIPDYMVTVKEYGWKDATRDLQLTVYEGERTAKNVFVLGSLLFLALGSFRSSSDFDKVSLLLYPLHLLCGYFLFFSYLI